MNKSEKLMLEHSVCDDEIVSLLKRIDKRLGAIDDAYTYPLLTNKKAARDYLILALHCLGGLTKQEEHTYKF